MPYSVKISSLKPYIKKATPLSVSELRQYRRRLRTLLRIYRIACSTPQPTATERAHALEKIRSAASKFINSRKKLWAERLLDYLQESDVNTNKLLYCEISASGHGPASLIAVKMQLRELFSRSIYPDELPPLPGTASRAELDRLLEFELSGVPIVRVLAKIDVNALVPSSGRWPDPALANLVAGVVPIWRRVTGRTASLTSTDKEGDIKECPFADWLGELLEQAKMRRSPVGRIVDIVRPRQRKKIKKSATHHSSGLGQ